MIDNLLRETYNAKENKDVKHRGRCLMVLAVTWQSNPPEKILKVKGCFTEYLTTYLGDQGEYHCRTCGECRAPNFPLIRLSERMLNAAARFLEDEFLPRIEKRGIVHMYKHSLNRVK